MPESVAKDDHAADLRWLKHLALLQELYLELPMSTTSVCTFDGLSALPQLRSVTLMGGQPQHLEDLTLLPNLTSLQLLRYRGTEVPACLGSLRTLQELTLELHNMPIQREADVSCLSTLRALNDLTLRTSRPARLCIASLKTLRASLSDLQRLHVAFCNCHWPAAEATTQWPSPPKTATCRRSDTKVFQAPTATTPSEF